MGLEIGTWLASLVHNLTLANELLQQSGLLQGSIREAEYMQTILESRMLPAA
jgi:hypothetical protein